ncbi:MAG: nitrate/nitrite transporter [Salinigranum sp.]
MSDSRPSLVLASSMLVFAGFSAYLIAPASVIPLLVGHFHVSGASAGAGVSAAYLGWVVFQLPSGVFMDRYDNRDLLTVAVVVYLAAAVAGAVAPSYLGFTLSRVVAGTAAGILWGVGANVVGGTFPAETRALATGVYTASGPLGLAVGQFATPLLAGWLPLQAVFAVYPLISLVGVVLFRVGLREDVRSGGRVPLRLFTRVLTNRSVLLLSLSGLCANGLWLFLNSWLPTYGADVLALPLATVGGLMALAPLAGGLARPSGGWMAARVGQRAVIAGSLLLALPLVFAFPLATSPARFGIGLFLAGFALQFSTGIYFAYVQELVADEFSGTGIATMTTFQVTGGFVAPVVGGWLIETTSWTTTFGLAGLVAVAGAASVLLLPRFGGATRAPE